MSMTDPSSNALFFTIEDGGDSFLAFLDINDFDGFSVFDVRYKKPSDQKYTFLIAPEITPKSTASEQDAEIERLLAIINEKIEETFGKGSATAPEFGIERVRWLLKNGMIEASNNQLSLKK